jgi:vacuolar-type H+-ATPase subunit I/STV1
VTLSTSNNKWATTLVKRYTILTIFAGVFSAIYEYNSHGVYSIYMMSLAFYPLLGGVVVFGVLSFIRKELKFPWLSRCLYHSCLVTWMMGSCIKGVLEIYGTSTEYVKYYWYMGAILLIASVLTTIRDVKIAERF